MHARYFIAAGGRGQSKAHRSGPARWHPIRMSLIGLLPFEARDRD
jgi:hypothetical protein